jgi:hypothetical protein
MLKKIKYQLVFEIVDISFVEVFMVHLPSCEQVFVSAGP